MVSVRPSILHPEDVILFDAWGEKETLMIYTWREHMSQAFF